MPAGSFTTDIAAIRKRDDVVATEIVCWMLLR